MSPARHLRRHLSAVFKGRAAAIALALVVSTAGALCFVPGFDALNYYSSLGLGLLMSLVAGVTCALRTSVAKAQGSIRSLAGAYLDSAIFALYLAAAASLPLLLNGFRVKNCDLLEGISFFGVGATFSAVFSSQVGTAVALLRGRTKAWLSGLGFLAVFLVWVLWDVLHLYFHPPIFAYNPFSGFFSGAIYDDLIELDGRLLWYRMNNIAQLGLVWSLTALLLNERLDLAGRHANRAGRAVWAAVVLSALAVSGFFGARGALGYEMSREAIAQALGGRLSAGKLELIYDRESISDRQAELLLEDHAFRLHQLETTLGPYDGKVTSYVYGDNSQKRALMGAGRVFIAKPWLHEIHIAAVPYATPVVHHELAHVVLGAYADSILNIPTVAGVIPNNALVEGAAEAMEWYGGQLTAHQWASAMRREGIAPDMASIVGADGFWKQSARKAYTLAGSFVRWLIDTQGAELLKDAYRDGDFARAYGVPLKELVERWERFVDTEVALPPEALALARQRFSRKGVLMRVCPLEVPRAEARANVAMAAGDIDRALALRRQVVDWVPTSASKRLTLLLVLARQSRLQEAQDVHEGIYALEGINDAAKARADELLADVTWRTGDAASAERIYAKLTTAPLSEGRRRNIAVKRLVSASPDLEPVLGPYLLGPAGDDEEAVEYLVEATVDLPDSALTSYLAGRRAVGAGQSVEGVTLLIQSLGLWTLDPERDPLVEQLVRRETFRMLGRAYYFLDQFDEAERAFTKAVELAEFASDRLTWQDWLERVRWRRER